MDVTKPVIYQLTAQEVVHDLLLVLSRTLNRNDRRQDDNPHTCRPMVFDFDKIRIATILRNIKFLLISDTYMLEQAG